MKNLIILIILTGCFSGFSQNQEANKERFKKLFKEADSAFSKTKVYKKNRKKHNKNIQDGKSYLLTLPKNMLLYKLK
jgi:hypothetical protein